MAVRILVLITLTGLGLAGCERFGDHPESIVRVHTGASDKISVYAREDLVRVEGVWTIDGPDKIAAPINLSTIHCWRNDGYCDVRRTEIMPMRAGPVMLNRDDVYAVARWTPNEVRATAGDGCRSHEIRIDIPGNSVLEITTNAPGGSCDGVTGYAVEQPRIARMISGMELEEIKKRGL